MPPLLRSGAHEEGMTRRQMAQRVARDIPAGAYVNLGIGLPVTVLDHFKPEDEIVVHSENGILGMRALLEGEAADPTCLTPPNCL